MAAPVLVTGATSVASTVIAAGVTHDAGRAAVIGSSVAAVMFLAKWLWKAILRQMREEIRTATSDDRNELKSKVDDLKAETRRRFHALEARVAELTHEVGEVSTEQRVQVERITGVHERLDGASSQVRTLVSQLDDLRCRSSATAHQEVTRHDHRRP